MRILFVCPRVSDDYKRHVDAVARKGWSGARFLRRDLLRNERSMTKSFYGLGLLTLASELPEGVDFVFVDENVSNEDWEDFYSREDYDVAALTAQLIQAGRARELMDFFAGEGKHVVVGGAHPTAFPEDYWRPGASVVTGEGELLFKAFLNDFARNRPRPFYASNGEECVDLRAAPFPRFSLLASCRYSLVGVQTTRGCPYRCRYCNVSRISGTRYRHKPADRVREEAMEVKGLWPESRFFFFDDNPFADRRYGLELMRALKDVPLGTWTAYADISISRHDELLDLVASNGSPTLYIGFETLSRRNADTLGNEMKVRYLATCEESIAKIRGKGIRVAGSFMFGFPGDTEEDARQVFAFARKNGFDAYITRYSALPGAALYDDLVAEYEAIHGPMEAKGTARAKIVNRYFMEKNGFGFWDTEEMLVNVLKEWFPSNLPMLALDNLAVYRTYFA